MPPAQPVVVFQQVKDVLTKIMDAWKLVNGEPDLLGVHRTAKFSWETRQELLDSTARKLPLIQSEVIGQNPKRGNEANIVVALRTGVNGFPQMPYGGPYAAEEDIQVIVDWIDGKCQP